MIWRKRIGNDRDMPERHDIGSKLVPIRICDAAARVLSRRVSDVHFDLAGERAQLDAQIQAIKQKLLRASTK